MAATVKNAGVGTRPRSIFRSVSTEIPAVDATATMLREPRAARSSRPSCSPRSRSVSLNGVRTMTVIIIPVLLLVPTVEYLAVIELKTPAEIEAMRAAGGVVATTLATVQEAATAGTSLRELDALARGVIADGGASPSFLGYHPPFAPTPFPGVICTSVNDVIVHGIPTDYRLADGDLLSVDCGAYIDGWHGDSAISFVVGEPEPADLRLIETARQALAAGIEAARPGNHIGDIGAAVSAVCRAAGYGIPPDFGGHGIGRSMHEPPGVPNEGQRGSGLPLRPGLVLAIEPMLLAGGHDAYTTDGDGWSLRTTDGSRAAHAEHTVAVTENGPEILTVP
jgi:methionyl aminopeptidase